MRNVFKRWKQRRKACIELHSMTNRQLNDIGINRCDIKRIVSDI